MTIGIRPEHIRLGAPDAAEQGVVGEVVYAEYLGESSYVHSRLASGETILAKEEGTARVRTGDRVRLVFAPEQIHVFDDHDQALVRTAELER